MLIIPNVEGKRGKKAHREPMGGARAMVVFWMVEFAQAGRSPKGLWTCKRRKVSVSLAWAPALWS